MSYKIISTHPLAQTVAREYGATVKVDGATTIVYGLTQQEFDETLAELIAEGVQPTINYAAYDKLQTEGYGNV